MKTSYALAAAANHAEVELAAYLDAEADGFRQSPETYWLRNEARFARSAAARKAAATRKANKAAAAQADDLLAEVVATAPKARAKMPRPEVRGAKTVRAPGRAAVAMLAV